MSLEARDIACFRADRLVLRDLSFRLARGRALLLTGANGAGKSTLLRLLAGLRRPDGGRILWDGTDIAEDQARHARRLRYVGEQNALKPGFTAAENLRAAAALAGCADPPHAAGTALAALALAPLAETPTRMLSTGQRRRLALARLAFPPLGEAPLWLLDEPTLGLDAGAVATLGTLMAAHLAAGGLLVAATHLALPLPGAATLAL
jgi:heme exporter protein A